jgi:DNA repair protein RadC
MYLNLDGNYDAVEESTASYSSDIGKKYLCNILGSKATDRLYEKLNSYDNILCAEPETLKWAGLTDKQIDCLMAARNLHNYKIVSKVKCSLDAYNRLKHISDCNVEHFYVICLNRNNQIICDLLISKGGTSATYVDPKVLFRKILIYPRMSAIILVHNHPSGNLEPSQCDLELTAKIKSGCQFLEISLLDHIIIGSAEKYYSFADSGKL